MCNSVLIIFTFAYLAWYKDASITAGFGLANSLYMLFCIIMQGNNELVGIQCAKCDGSKNYWLLRQTFFKSLFVNYMIFVVSVCVYCRADILLMGVGILEDTSINAHKIVLWMLPGFFVQTTNEILKSYLIAIGVTTPFFWLNIVLIVLYPFLGYIFIWQIGFGGQGFGAIILIREVISFVVFIIYLSKTTNQEHNFM